MDDNREGLLRIVEEWDGRVGGAIVRMTLRGVETDVAGESVFRHRGNGRWLERHP